MYRFKFIESGKGNIQINEYVESFDAEYSFWSKEQYENHWKASEKRLIEGKSAMFITSITDPVNSNFIRAWVCYPIENELVFQEHIVFLNELEEPFDPLNPHKSIQEYENKTEEGENISEWRTNAA